MESQEHRHAYGRLATFAFLIGTVLCVVQVAQGLNEQNLLGRAPAALGFLLGGFLLAAILRAIDGTLAKVDEHVARIEDATHTYSQAAADLAARARHGPVGNGAAAPAPAPAQPAAALVDAFDVRSSPAPQVTPAPAPAPAPANAPEPVDARAPQPAPAPVDVGPVDVGPVDVVQAGDAPTDGVPPPETAIAAALLATPGPESEPEPAPSSSDPARQPEVIVPPIMFVEPTDPIPEFTAVDPDAEFAAVQERVQAMLSADAWAEAAAEAEALALRFPDHAPGRQLVARVARQRELAAEQASPPRPPQPAASARPDEPPSHREHPGRNGGARDDAQATALDPEQEAAFQHTLERVQAAVDQRQWRDALVGAEQITQFFPGHPRAAAIREQLVTIRDNAEIQDRREKEGQIETLIRDGRFNEAMTVANDVIQRYPDSPQAKNLDQMLPRLQDLADRFGG